MSSIKKIFDQEIIEISEKCFIHVIKIEELTDELKSHIDKQIISICDADQNTSIEIVNKELRDFFEGKDASKKMGALAEFIVHLYLRDTGFSQECLFTNLEEGSIKKGFDGYYSFSSKEWIMESKSGTIRTEGISHKKKLKEAYKDLKEKIEGRSKNNPWKNAFHHAKIVESDSTILRNLKELSKMYTMETYPDMDDLNIVPSSTIFHENIWIAEDLECPIDEISKAIGEMQYCNINAICINKKSLELMLNYLINS